MLNHLLGDSRHVERLPGTHFGILTEESDECEFLFVIEPYLDLDCLVGGAAGQWN